MLYILTFLLRIFYFHVLKWPTHIFCQGLHQNLLRITIRAQLDPNKRYEAALLSLDMYNSIPNIIEGKIMLLSIQLIMETHGKSLQLIPVHTSYRQ